MSSIEGKYDTDLSEMVKRIGQLLQTVDATLSPAAAEAQTSPPLQPTPAACPPTHPSTQLSSSGLDGEDPHSQHTAHHSPPLRTTSLTASNSSSPAKRKPGQRSRALQTLRQPGPAGQLSPLAGRTAPDAAPAGALLDPRTTLGIMMINDVVDHLVPGGPAYLAGIQKGDRVVQVEGVAVEGQAVLVALSVTDTPGDTVEVQVMRSSKAFAQKITAVLTRASSQSLQSVQRVFEVLARMGQHCREGKDARAIELVAEVGDRLEEVLTGYLSFEADRTAAWPALIGATRESISQVMSLVETLEVNTGRMELHIKMLEDDLFRRKQTGGLPTSVHELMDDRTLPDSPGFRRAPPPPKLPEGPSFLRAPPPPRLPGSPLPGARRLLHESPGASKQLPESPRDVRVSQQEIEILELREKLHKAEMDLEQERSKSKSAPGDPASQGRNMESTSTTRDLEGSGVQCGLVKRPLLAGLESARDKTSPAVALMMEFKGRSIFVL